MHSTLPFSSTSSRNSFETFLRPTSNLRSTSDLTTINRTSISTSTSTLIKPIPISSARTKLRKGSLKFQLSSDSTVFMNRSNSIEFDYNNWFNVDNKQDDIIVDYVQDTEVFTSKSSEKNNSSTKNEIKPVQPWYSKTLNNQNQNLLRNSQLFLSTKRINENSNLSFYNPTQSLLALPYDSNLESNKSEREITKDNYGQENDHYRQNLGAFPVTNIVNQITVQPLNSFASLTEQAHSFQSQLSNFHQPSSMYLYSNVNHQNHSNNYSNTPSSSCSNIVQFPLQSSQDIFDGHFAPPSASDSPSSFLPNFNLLPNQEPFPHLYKFPSLVSQDTLLKFSVPQFLDSRNDSFESQEINYPTSPINFRSLSPLASTIAPLSPSDSLVTDILDEVEVLQEELESEWEEKPKVKAGRRKNSTTVQSQRRVKSDTPQLTSNGESIFGTFNPIHQVYTSNGKLFDLQPQLETNSFIYTSSISSWICYRRNHLTFNAELKVPTHDSLYISLNPEDESPTNITRLEIELTSVLPKTSKKKRNTDSTSSTLLQLDKNRKLNKAVELSNLRFNLPSLSYSQQLNSTPQSTGTKSLKSDWNRIQFKRATLNNLRKKGSEVDHYLLKGKVLAFVSTPTGELRIEIGRWESGKIVVRGRSPKDFEKKDRELEERVDESEGEEDYVEVGSRKRTRSASTGGMEGEGKKRKVDSNLL